MTRDPYDTFSYQPMLRYWFMGNTHINAVSQFQDWLKRKYPKAHAGVMAKKPELFSGENVVASGKMGLLPRAGGSTTPRAGFPPTSWFKGLGEIRAGDYATPRAGRQPGSYFGMGGLGQDTGSAEPSIMTDWGNNILDLAKGYLAYDTQKDLLKLNIARAEQGLAPIDPGSIAPQVNVGLSPATQNLAIYGLIGVGLIAALMAVTGKKRR